MKLKGGGLKDGHPAFQMNWQTLWELMLGHLGRKLPNRRDWESKDEESNCEGEVL